MIVDTFVSDNLLLAWHFGKPVLWLAVWIGLPIAILSRLVLWSIEDREAEQLKARGHEPSKLAAKYPSFAVIVGFCLLFALLGCYLGQEIGNSRVPVIGAVVPA